MIFDPNPQINSLTILANKATILSCIVAILSFIFAVYQFFKRKSHDDTLNGFLHGIEPNIEASSRGAIVPKEAWSRTLTQIHDMMERLQPPNKKK